MNKQTILQKIDNIRAGTFHRATFLSKPKPASAFKDVSLVKITSGVYRSKPENAILQPEKSHN